MNTYQSNVVTGATPNPVMPNPVAIDEEFIETAKKYLAHEVSGTTARRDSLFRPVA